MNFVFLFRGTFFNALINTIFLIGNFIIGFGSEYFYVHGDESSKISSKQDDKSFLQGYKSVLNSKATEESLVIN